MDNLNTGQKFKFICPKCKHTELEEVTVAAVVSTIVTGISDDNYLEYEGVSIDDGTIDRYQCSNCGYAIKKYRKNITESGELIEWLAKQPYNKSKKGGDST